MGSNEHFMPNSFVQVATVSEIPPGQTLRIQHEQHDILLANVGGTLYRLRRHLHP